MPVIRSDTRASLRNLRRAYGRVQSLALVVMALVLGASGLVPRAIRTIAASSGVSPPPWLPSEPGPAFYLLLVLLSLLLFVMFRALRRTRALVDDTLAETELARRRAELVAETAPDAIFTVDTQRRILTWNRASEQITGYRADEVLGRSCESLAAAPCGGRCLLFDGAADKPVTGIECSIVRKDGERRTIVKNIDVIRDADGVVVGGIEAFEDVTDRRRLQERWDRFNRLIEGTHIENLFFDAETCRLLEMNGPALRNLGLDWDAQEARSFLDLVPSLSRETFETLAAPLRTGERDKVVTVVDFARGDGSRYPVELHLRLSRGEHPTFAALAIDITQRSHVEQELLDSREQLQMVLEGADLGLWDWDLRTNEVKYNARWAEILGYRLGEIESRLETWKRLVHPEDLRPTMNLLRAHLEGKTETYESEHRMRHKSGLWIWILDRGRVTERDADGKPVRACGTHLDITRRKQMELEREILLQSTEESVKVLQGLIGVAEVITVSPDLESLLHRTALLMPSAWTYPGSARSRITLDGMVQTSAPFEPTPWRLAADIVIDDVVRGAVEVYYLDERPEMDEGPFCTEERELINGITSMLTGAVERHLAERKLLRQRSELEQERTNLQAIFDAAQVGMLLIDDSLQVVKINGVMAELLGPEIMGLQNKSPGNLMSCLNAVSNAQGCGNSPYCGRCEIRATIGEVLETGAAVRNRESSLQVLVDHSVRTYHFSISASAVQMSGARHVLLSLFDLTESRALERQLAQALKLEAVGQLAAGIAHEINTPTQFVSDSVYFLRDAFADQMDIIARYRGILSDLPEGPDRAEALARAAVAEDDADLAYLTENVPRSLDRSLDGLTRIAGIVGAMKEFSHPGQHEQAHADLTEALKATLTIATNEYKYVADVETDFGPLPPVRCQVGDLNQVFLNLLVNAAHAIEDAVGDSGAKGVIRVRTRAEAEWAVIEIEDTGPGVPPEVRSRIFEPFFTTKEVGRGSGQGLAIAHSIITDKHGGAIDFRCGRDGGTTFTIRIPIGGLPTATREEVTADAAHPVR